MTVRYENGKPVGVTQIVLSTQHLDDDAEILRRRPRASSSPISAQALPEGWIADDTVWHVNPTGKFVIGGPDGDCGLTGRKIIVDTYGGAAPHGGGAFSGKDPTKVDRSAAYAARYLAKNVVAAGLADRCTIQLSYAIGVAQPLSIYVDLHGTGKVDEDQARERPCARSMDLSPRGIRDASRPQQADLRQDLRLWPFRPQAGAATAASPGSGPTSPRRSRRPSRPDARRPMRAMHRAMAPADEPASLLRAAQGQDAAGRTGRSCSTTLLPRLRLDLAERPLAIRAALFAPRSTRIRLEIGFGGGEHLLPRRARRTRDVGFIGCEPFVNGMAKLLARDRARAARQYPALRRRRERRARLAAGRPRIDRIDLLYPDPWPKRRHWKRRFVGTTQSRPLRPRAEAGRPTALRHRHRRLCGLDAARGWRARRLRLDGGSAPTTGGALGRLARHALRGQGAARGPRADAI